MVITTDTPDTPPDTINTLWFADTTVARVSNTLSNSLFMLGYVRNVTLVRSVFADSATMNPDFEASYSGLGYVVALTAVGACTACEFTNCTTANYAGVMLIISDTPYNSSFAIANTTCIRCSGMQTSTWLFAFVRLTVTDTSFHSCWSAAADDMYGGVLDIDQDCVATIERCLFYNCTGKYSGGVLGYMCTITITDCVFMRNHASGYDVLTEFGNDVFGMNVTSIEIAGGYTDQPSYALSVGCETEVGTCSAWCVRDWCSEEKNVTCPQSSGERNKKTVSTAVIWSLICVFVFMII